MNIKISILLTLASYVNSWVFNEVNYADLRESVNDKGVFNQTQYELTAQERFSLIYPGTKWCGTGNVADGYDDLGVAAESDACCRDHDHCPEVIPAGETKYNLTNTAFYSRLSCKCDETFRKCLRAVNSKTSNSLGTMYFNVLSTKCYRKDFPTVGCKRRGGWLKRKCLEYEYDKSSKRIYQWFDVPKF